MILVGKKVMWSKHEVEMTEGEAHVHGSRLKTGDVDYAPRQMLGRRDDRGGGDDERDTQCQGTRDELVYSELGL